MTDEVTVVRTLTQREIVDKDFSKKVRGYDPEEVDEFLDIIIQDYKS
ncbi:MAG TPA: DivIVA domain-containing protein, partial [Atopostipes sp.]|nr:DivIVA domain-containing protein [Atopostipes sp.]